MFPGEQRLIVSNEEKETSESASFFEFICSPVPEEEKYNLESLEQYYQRKDSKFAQALVQRFDEKKKLIHFPFNSEQILKQKEILHIKAEARKPGQRFTENVCKLKLRFLGYSNPDQFIKSCLSQFAIDFYDFENETAGINYEKIIDLARQLKKYFPDPVSLLDRAIKIGIVIPDFLVFGKDPIRFRDIFNKLMQFPEEKFNHGASFLQKLTWLPLATTSNEFFESKLLERIDFINKLDILSLEEKTALQTQDVLDLFCGSPLTRIGTILETNIVFDLFEVAKELSMQSVDSSTGRFFIKKKLIFLAEYPDVLKKLAEIFRKGYKLEYKFLAEKLESSKFDRQEFDWMTKEVHPDDEVQKNLGKILDFQSIESQVIVNKFQELIEDTIGNFDLETKKHLLISILPKEKTDVLLAALVNFGTNDLLDRWIMLDLSIYPGKSNNLNFSPENHRLSVDGRIQVIKRIFCRTLLYKDKKEFDFELIDYLLQYSTRTMPIQNYFDEATINLMPPVYQTLLKFLWKVNQQNELGVWNFAVENKQRLPELLDKNGKITIYFVKDFFESSSAVSYYVFRELKSLLEEAKILPGLMEYLEIITPTLNASGLDFRKEPRPLINIFFTQQHNPVQRELELSKLWAQKCPPASIDSLSKKSFVALVGEENAEEFFATLPKATNERRNALLHNKFDRTSEWLKVLSKKTYKSHLLQNTSHLMFHLETDIKIASNFINSFGLAQNVNLFIVYKALYLAKFRPEFKIPDSITDLGLKSLEDLYNQYSSIEKYLTAEEPLLDVVNLSPFQKMLLTTATGMDSHTFTLGRTINEIIDGYKFNLENNKILVTDKEFEVVDIELKDIEITYEPSQEVVHSFDKLISYINEILFELPTGKYWQKVMDEFTQLINQKKSQLQKILSKMPEEKKIYLSDQLQQIELISNKASQIQTLDQALILIGSFIPEKQQQNIWSEIIKKLVLNKLLEVNQEQNKLRDLVASSELTPKALLTAINVYDEIIKHHVVDFTSDDSSDYWTESVREFFNANENKKLLKNVKDVFAGLAKLFKGDVDRFTEEQLSSQTIIKAIPDKGLMGEMSGYIANACYTKEYPLLSNWPVTPYRFVDKSKTPPELIGTTLVFEVNLQGGEKALLVRAFNIPKEDQYNISALLEAFLDSMRMVAQKKGAKQVLLPGISGAMSNYQLTINHIKNKYEQTKTRANLSEPFIFNAYDLTNNCLVAREI